MEITVKLPKPRIVKHTFRTTTYKKAIEFRFTMQYQSFSWLPDEKKVVLVALMCVRVRE